MTDRALTVQPEMALADTMTLGKTLAASGYFKDAKQAAQAVVKILAGRELGFGPIASMTGINIIQGKIAVGANLLAASVKRDPRYDYQVADLSDERCELIFYANGQEAGRSTFTMQNARETMYWNSKSEKMEPLAGKFNWRSYPRNMLFARAMSNGVKWYAPDAFGGNPVYTPDELGAQTDGATGEMITAEVISPTTGPEAAAQIYPEAKQPEAPQGVPADYGEFYRRALAENGDFGGYYTSREHAINTIRQTHPGFTDKGDKTTITEAWAALGDHVASKKAEADPAPHWSDNAMDRGLFLDALDEHGADLGNYLVTMDIDKLSEDRHATYQEALVAFGIGEGE